MRIDVSVITSAMTEPRRKHCLGVLETLSQHHDVTSRFVTEHDDVDQQFIKDSVKLESVAAPEHFNKYLQTLHVRNVSNARKHLAALKHIAESDLPEETVFLVLEDDAMPCKDWTASLASLCSSLPEDYGLVSLGVPSPDAPLFRLQNAPDVLPVCDSYIVSRKAAATLSSSFCPVRYPTNVHLSYLTETLGVSCHVANPTVFLDGTKVGGFISVLSPNNRLTLNAVFMNAWRDITATSDAEKLKQLVEDIKSGSYADHPDFLYLAAMATGKMDGPEAAEPLFKSAMEVYDANAALLTSESTFLRDFINIYKDAQDLPTS